MTFPRNHRQAAAITVTRVANGSIGNNNSRQKRLRQSFCCECLIFERAYDAVSSQPSSHSTKSNKISSLYEGRQSSESEPCSRFEQRRFGGQNVKSLRAHRQTGAANPQTHLLALDLVKKSCVNFGLEWWPGTESNWRRALKTKWDVLALWPLWLWLAWN